MCGIVGYVGAREAAPILLEGLARLEYRGYDSAGIALVTEEGDLYIRKRAGKVADLRASLASGTPPARAGLAHTRWATHGRPNDLNAHPHIDCTGELTVIHNGIIENFIELRAELEAAGHAFESETDTEAIAHLVEESYAGDLADAVRAALKRARGAYALAVIHKGEPDRVVGARMNVPLIVGLGDGEAFLASDVAAVLAHTRRVIFLEEGDVADIRPGGVRVTDMVGRPLERPVHEVDWDLEAAEKGGYEHFMLKEIHEQPEAILAAITGRIHDSAIRVAELDGLAARLRDIDRIELVACGSAAYASAVASTALQAWTGLPARWNIGSEFRYDPPPLDARTLVIAVTQSGETADTLAPTRLARQQGCPIVAVTNTVGSAITREADAVLYLQAGPEIAVVATKTYVTQVVTLLLIAAQVAKSRGRLDRALRGRPGRGSARPAGRSRARYRAQRGAGPGACAALPRVPGLHVRRSRHHLPGRARRRPQAQGGQLRPRRRLRRWRAEAWPHLAARRRSPPRRRGYAHLGPRQARQQPHGGPRPRRARHRRGDRGRRAHEGRRRRHHVGARDGGDALTRPGHHPAAALRVPHRRGPRHGRRPAAQPGQVGHRRVSLAEEPTPPTPAAGLTELGIDIIQVERISRALAKHGRRFPLRILTPAEDAYVRDRPENMAGRWAAKEAVSKVLGLGVRGVGWREIEIVRLPTGQPTVRLHDRALRRADQLGMERVAVSISHEHEYAIAVAIGYRTTGGTFVFPVDVEARLEDRERQLMARMRRLRDLETEVQAAERATGLGDEP